MVVGNVLIAANNITISTSNIDGKEKISLDFNNLSNILKGDTFYVSAFGDSLETESIASSTPELWLDWVVSSFNIKSSNSVASRNGKILEILCNDSTESNVSIETGNI